MTDGRDVEIKVGRRAFDGTIRLSPHPPQLLQLSVSYKGERSSSVVLTRDQIKALQQALAEFEQALSNPNEAAEVWDHSERRANTTGRVTLRGQQSETASVDQSHVSRRRSI